MIQNDYEQFMVIFGELKSMYGKSMPEEGQKLYWQVLQQYSIEDLKKAIQAHLQDGEGGKFFPMPAHLIAQLQANDGRLTADEWWPSLPRSEQDSCYWSIEAKQAYFVALPLIESGDEIAARMSFKAAYENAVLHARRNHEPIRYEFSQGWDPQGREKALLEAVTRGLLIALLPEASFNDYTAITGLGKHLQNAPPSHDKAPRIDDR